MNSLSSAILHRREIIHIANGQTPFHQHIQETAGVGCVDCRREWRFPKEIGMGTLEHRSEIDIKISIVLVFLS